MPNVSLSTQIIVPLLSPMHPGLSFEEWEQAGHFLAAQLDAAIGRLSTLQWHVADWLHFGECEYGERYAQGMDVLGLDYQTCANMNQVGERFPPERRHPRLSFSHHQEAAFLEPGVADVILDRAESEGLSAREVRGLAQTHRSLAAGRDPARERAAFTLDRALQDVRECEPGSWPDLIFQALKPMCRASGFARRLACLLLSTVEEDK